MTKPEVIDGGQILLPEAGGQDYIDLMDGYGAIHHLTSRAIEVKDAQAKLFALEAMLIEECKWTVANDVREVLPYGNKTRQNELHNPEGKPEPIHVPCDGSGNELVPDKGEHLPGDTGFWHVTNVSLGKLKEGHVKVVMEGLAGEKKAEFPWVSVNMTLGMVKHILEIIRPESVNDEYYNDPHDDVVNWKVNYRYGNKLNDKGYYWKNVEAIEPWGE